MSKLPIPDFFDSGKLDQVWRVPYDERAKDAKGLGASIRTSACFR